MAVGTPLPEASSMGIVRSMTAPAGPRSLRTARHRTAMTSGTREVQVCIAQLEVRRHVMLESPELPPVRVVASLALSPQRPFMHVVRPMTALTRDVSCPVHVIVVARFTRGRRVDPQKRKIGQIVIEEHSARKRVFVVAVPTIRPKIPLMHIVHLMTSDAIRVSTFLAVDPPRMACIARCPGMRSDEWELRSRIVIELHATPPTRGMAGSAVLTETTRMNVFTRVTAGTVLGKLSFTRRLAMTRATFRPLVSACERKSGLFAVIESRFLPCGRGMTLAAIGSEPILMHVIDRMTRHTIVRRSFVAPADVAARTTCRNMRASKGVLRLVVVETGC